MVDGDLPNNGNLSFTRVRTEGQVELLVEGHLDLTGTGDFARELRGLFSDRSSVTVVDLSRVTRIDDSAVGELQDAVRAAGRASIDLVVTPPSPGPERQPEERDDMSPSRPTFERSDRAYGRTLAIAGEIDMAVARELAAELAALVAEAHSPAYVDLSGVDFMDATGVHALVGAARAGVLAGAPIVLVSVSRSCRRVLEATGVWELFRVRDPHAGETPGIPAPS